MNRLSEPKSTSISIGFAAGAGIAGMTSNAAPGEAKAVPGRAERGRAERGKVGPSRVEPGRVEAAKAGVGKAEPGKAEPGKAAPATTGVPSDSSSRPRAWIVRS